MTKSMPKSILTLSQESIVNIKKGYEEFKGSFEKEILYYSNTLKEHKIEPSRSEFQNLINILYNEPTKQS